MTLDRQTVPARPAETHESLRARANALQQDGAPGLRQVDLAHRLGVSEARWLAAVVDASPGSARLRADEMETLLHGLEQVGEVMVLTRNSSCVHEKVGRFGQVSVSGAHAIVLNHEVDLRIFPRQWVSGFAYQQPLPDGSTRPSLQFFDGEGVAVHKVFAREATDHGAWARLVDALRHPDADASLDAPVGPAAEAATRADAEVEVGGLREAWAAMRDTHEFFGMLRRFDVGRVQALRLVGGAFAERLEAGAVGPMLERAAVAGQPVMCFVGNRGCIQIHTGPVRNIRVMGDWLNVLDPGFNLHLRADRIASAWRVRKPTDDGVVTSIEIYDERESTIAQFFGERKPGQAEREDWRELAASLPCFGAGGGANPADRAGGRRSEGSRAGGHEATERTDG